MPAFIRPIVFPNEGFCYLENAKCGSSSILEALASDRSASQSTDREGGRLAVIRSPDTIGARNLPLAIKTSLVRSFCHRMVFSFVRNPYVRLLSAYIDLIERPTRFPLPRLEAFGYREDVTFEEFVHFVVSQSTPRMNFHWRPQADLLAPWFVNYDFIGRMERFQEDLQFISGAGAAPGHGWGQMHKTDTVRAIPEYYNPELSALVAQRYQSDFELFGYYRNTQAINDFDDSALRLFTGNGERVPDRGARWHAALRAACVTNMIQRSPLWSAAWKGRRMVARIRAARLAR